MGIDAELKQAIREAIETDRLTGQKLKDILLNGPRDAAKGLQEWNLEDGLILYKGLVYMPNNENLKRKVVQQYHDELMGHPGEWKTIELITRDFWWPGITTFVKAYIKCHRRTRDCPGGELGPTSCRRRCTERGGIVGCHLGRWINCLHLGRLR